MNPEDNKTEDNKTWTTRLEQIVNHQAEDSTVPDRFGAAPAAPIYASPWLALYSHLKATLSQKPIS